MIPIVQLASVALSDSLQLVDDTIRSILASTDAEERDDVAMLKQAVEQSTKRFSKWLAAALERVAGCESSDPKVVIDAKAIDPQEGGEEGKAGQSAGYGDHESVVDPHRRSQKGLYQSDPA